MFLPKINPNPNPNPNSTVDSQGWLEHKDDPWGALRSP